MEAAGSPADWVRQQMRRRATACGSTGGGAGQAANSACAAASRRSPAPRAVARRGARGGRRGRAQRQCVAARHRRRHLLLGVSLEDERHRPDIVSMIQGRRPRGARGRRAGHRQRRARGLLGRREPVRADGRHRPERHGRINQLLEQFQNACQRMRYARVPVVGAPFGLALGGGAEVVLGCQSIRASTELYIGCVEVGVGLIPAGGGCMELAARAAAKASDDPYFDLLSLVRVPFEMLARARVSTSAEEARDMGYLRHGDHVDGARDAARRRQAGGAGPGARRLSAAAAAAHPRHRRVRRGDDAALHEEPGRRAPDQRARRQDQRPPGPHAGGRQRARRARPSASSTSSTSSARPSCRCAGNQRPASASNTC